MKEADLRQRQQNLDTIAQEITKTFKEDDFTKIVLSG